MKIIKIGLSLFILLVSPFLLSRSVFSVSLKGYEAVTSILEVDEPIDEDGNLKIISKAHKIKKKNIYADDGTYLGFTAYGSIYNATGDVVGTVTPDGRIFSFYGRFVGLLPNARGPTAEKMAGTLWLIRQDPLLKNGNPNWFRHDW